MRTTSAPSWRACTSRRIFEVNASPVVREYCVLMRVAASEGLDKFIELGHESGAVNRKLALALGFGGKVILRGRSVPNQDHKQDRNRYLNSGSRSPIFVISSGARDLVFLGQ